MLLVSIFLLAAPCWMQPQQSADEVVANMRPGAWKMLGPMKGSNSKGARDLRTSVKKMQAGVPWSTLRKDFAGANDSVASWTTVDLESFSTVTGKNLVNPVERRDLDSGAIDLRTLVPGEQESEKVVYLYRPVYANDASTTVVTCGAAGKMSLWWNGKRMISNKEFHTLKADNTKLTFDLQPGVNHLLIEVSDDYLEWKFEMRSLGHVDVHRINRSIDLGVEYLLDTQLIDGSWPPYGHYTNGTNALAIYTLIRSGQSPRSEAVLKGLAFLREQSRAPGTYSSALELMAFDAGGDAQDKELITSIAQGLIQGQSSNGLWSYGASHRGGGGDLSNTQYAALGLRAAAHSGVEIPQSTWENLVRATLACRKGGSGQASTTATRGFGYSVGSSPRSSMTAAGIGTLAICLANMKQGSDKKLARKAESAIEGGIRWLDKNWTLMEGAPSMNNYYFLYGLERAGGLADREMFGKHSWYLEGAERIVNDQESNGRWDNDPSPLVESFALLFLRRATSRHALTSVNLRNDRLRKSSPDGGPLQLRLSLNNPNALWIDSGTEGFSEIARVVYWLQAPDSPWQKIEEMFENRFAIQHDLAVPGDWKVRADAQLNDGSLLTSGTIEFHQREGISAERLAYVTEGRFNIAPAGSPTIKASSYNQKNLPQALTDGLYSTSWRCKSNDSQPQVDISFRRSRKASVLKLVMTPRALTTTHGASIPQLVEVTINDLPPKMMRVPTYIHEKALLEFDGEIQVKRIKLRVISLDRGRLGQNVSVGFAEVELY
jgi:hypothetical protein